MHEFRLGRWEHETLGETLGSATNQGMPGKTHAVD